MGGPARPSDPQIDSYRFGSVAYLLGYATLKQIQKALAEQVEDDVMGGKHRLLGSILRERGVITDEQETEILANMKTIGK